jgi:hypothetical protein
LAKKTCLHLAVLNIGKAHSSAVAKETEEIEDNIPFPFVSKTGTALDTAGEDKEYYQMLKATFIRNGVDISSIYAENPIILNLGDKGGKNLHFLQGATVTISSPDGIVAFIYH